MRTKKLRGLKSKARNMVRLIEQETVNFPSDLYDGYWQLKLPVARGFISTSKTPYCIK